MLAQAAFARREAVEVERFVAAARPAVDIGVLITDHNVLETLDIVDRACIIYDGQVLFEGTPQALVADEQVRRLYLGESFAL
jgi:ABC-type lipopolysaccharide export system ATPase subunit